MNIPLLQELSYQITEGNPLWGLSLLNARGDIPPAIRRALLQAFEQRLGDTIPLSPVALALKNGARATELSTTQQHELGSRAIRKKFPCPMPLSTPRSKRAAIRQRLSTGSRHRRPPTAVRLVATPSKRRAPSPRTTVLPPSGPTPCPAKVTLYSVSVLPPRLDCR
jgi:hypothetical protein